MEKSKGGKDRAVSDGFATDIGRAVGVLNAGGVIAYPTDTIWGLGCDATNPEAVRRVFEIKKRHDSKALIALVDSPAKLEFYVRDVPEIAWRLIDVATSPITIIYDNARNLAPNLLADDGSVAIRITSEPFSSGLCRRFKRAVVSTSANVSGQKPPETFADISREILDAVDYVCESRRLETAPHRPSGIIRLGVSGEVKVIR